MTSAGSPGSNCCSEKIRMETKNSVGTSWTRRRARKFSISPQSLQLQPDDAHQPVRHLLVALELRGVRDQDPAVIEIEKRLFIKHNPGQLFIDRFSLRLICNKTGTIERLVGIRIGPGAVVLRRSGFLEDVGIAVRIDPSAPRQHDSLVFA